MAEATTERPSCGSSNGPKDYNVGMHVFALFLILVLSFAACAFPIAARKVPSIPIPRRTLFLSRHFGTGVLLATAFVHLLPTAFTSLTDPCLSPFWNEGYPAMAGFIAMVSVFVVVGIEMFFAARGAGHSHGSSEYVSLGGSQERDGHAEQNRVRHERGNGPMERKRVGLRRFEDAPTQSAKDSSQAPAGKAMNGGSQKKHHETNDDNEEEDLELDELEETEGYGEGHSLTTDHGAADVDTNGEVTTGPSSSLTEHQAQQRALLQCLLLEAGILFHSVFIGMAVSVATGAAFVVLLIAISFHQTFEGLALGSRIAAITVFPKRSPKPWLMALAYGTTTPIGQAIGLFVHNLYDPRSQMGLLMVGVMNAISSGLLLFAGLVELLAEDFLSEKSYDTLRGARRIEACAAVVVGGMSMALIGAFA